MLRVYVQIFHFWWKAIHKAVGGEKNRRIIDLQDSRVAGREGGVKRRKRILLEQPKVLRVFFFKKKKKQGHACIVCLALATRPAAFNLLVSNAHYQQFPAMGKRHERDLRVIKKTKRDFVWVYLSSRRYTYRDCFCIPLGFSLRFYC